MPVRREDAHRALELLEEYHKRLINPQDRSLRIAIEKVIRIFKSRLFQALMDIQEYYEVTLLDDTKSVQQKTQETLHVAARWEKQPLLPPQNERRVTPPQQSEEEPLPPPPPELVAAASVAPTVARPPPPIQPKPKKPAQEAPSPVAALKASPAQSYPPTEDVDGQYASINGVDEWEYEEIVLERGSGGLGFSIAGGKDTPHVGNDPSVYITKVIDGGAAARDGRMRNGDVLVSVNDVRTENVFHADAVEALKKAGNTVRLMIRRPKASGEQVIELYLIKGNKGLGFSIAGGRGNQHVPGDDGIFITKIIDGGAAQQDGRIAVGDRLMAVNEHLFDNITHEEAVAVLKSTHDRVRLLIGKPAYNASDATDSLLRSKKDPVVAQYGASSTDGSPVYATVNKVNRSSSGEPKISREPRKIIMRKGTSGLGFNIVGGEDGEGIFVSFILAGGPADLSGELHKGDQLISVNKIDLTNATHEQAAAVLKSSSDVVEIIAQYKPDEYTRFEAKINSLRENIMSVSTGSLRTTQKKTMFVRALFDYDSTKDSGLPNRGLSFHFGDILHVTNASDDEWWQARRVFPEGDDDGIGIIPSKKRVEKKERARLRNVKFPGKAADVKGGTAEKKKKGGKKFSFMKGGKDNSEEGASNEDLVDSPAKLSLGDEPVLSYELVIQQEVKYARPVLILGPLKDRINDDLLADFPRKFGNCVPHTTRSRRDNEVDGRDYHFISREQMDQDINNHLFIEAGQYNNNLYGTSVASVREVADSGRHCVLDVSGHAIKRLLATGLYPIAVLTKPISAENVMTWLATSFDDAQKQFEKTVKMEEELKELFTALVTGNTADEVYAVVKDVIQQHSGSTVWIASAEKL